MPGKDEMRDERIIELMKQLGMDNSLSLYGVIRQVANEVEQETREKCARMVDHIAKEGGGTYGDLMRW